MRPPRAAVVATHAVVTLANPVFVNGLTIPGGALGFDGLIVPSARCDCDNLVLFNDNQAIASELEVVASEEVDWLSWSRDHGILDLADETVLATTPP